MKILVSLEVPDPQWNSLTPQFFQNFQLVWRGIWIGMAIKVRAACNVTFMKKYSWYIWMDQKGSSSLLRFWLLIFPTNLRFLFLSRDVPFDIILFSRWPPFTPFLSPGVYHGRLEAPLEKHCWWWHRGGLRNRTVKKKKLIQLQRWRKELLEFEEF